MWVMNPAGLLRLVVYCAVLFSSLSMEMDEFYTIAKPCDFECNHGACSFENCNPSPGCAGGACFFYNCTSPTCKGGMCIFEKSPNSTCDGGACTFKDPSEILSAGYCLGHNCNINGQTHPHLSNHLTV